MTTIKKKISLSGKGIHSGLPVNLVIKPSKKHGIFFKRIDLPNSDVIAASFDNVGETKMRNTKVRMLNVILTIY